METTYNFNTTEIIKSLGLNNGGRVQQILDSQVQYWLRQLMPVKNGIMKANTTIVEPGLIRIGVPYAHYINEGIKYVMPTNNKSAFYSPSYGFWSTPGLRKVSSGEKLNTKSHFVEGAIYDHYEDILQACKKGVRQ